MARVLGIGDNCVDIYVDKGVQYPGGNAVNVAVYCKRLGLDAAYLGCVGPDALGDIIRQSLDAEGIDQSRMRVADIHTAWTRVRHENGDRYFDGSHVLEGRFYKLSEDDFTYMSSFDLVHTSVNSKLEEHITRIADASKALSFDFSNRISSDYIGEIAPSVDIAILSAAELSESDTRQLCESVSVLGPTIVIATRGAKGAFCLHNGVPYWQSNAKATVVDTLGAGDAFIAAFLSAHLRSEPPQTVLRRAAQYAAEVCSWDGAFGHGFPIKTNQPGLNAAGSGTEI